MKDQFYNYDRAKKENQTLQKDNKYYMSDTKDIIIFQINGNKENVIYKSPLLEDTYRTSQELWKNLTKEKPKQVFNSRDEFLRANCPFTDDELCEIAEAESKMYN